MLDSVGPSNFSASMEEGRFIGPGALKVGYFRGNETIRKSHVKCTIFDENIVVLGSGNMDRASWYTSQELGVALKGVEIVREVWGKLEVGLEEAGGVEWLTVEGYGAIRER